MKSIKRIIVVMLVALATIGSANAQFRFGVKAGVNLNKVHLDNLESNFSADNGAGFTGGVMAEFQVPIIGLCFDASLMYTRMNGDIFLYENIGDAMQSMVKTKANNFFQIPINLKWKIGLPAVSQIVTPYIFTGPDFAFRLGGQNNYFKTKSVQYAWNLGLGVELVRHLQISGSYGFGINNILDKTSLVDNAHLSNDIKSKNNYWTVTAAWLF